MNNLGQVPYFQIPAITLWVFIIIAILIFAVLYNSKLNKEKRINELQESHNRLMRSFNELDEQAKLIVKTDLELNKAQEELDKRLNSLDSLQKTSRLISTTLDENEIFHRLNQPLMTDLGFEKYLLLIIAENHKFHCQVFSGYSNEAIQYILSHLDNDTDLMTAFKEGHTFSSISSAKQRKEKIQNLFNVEHFILTPILSQNGMIGVIFVGNQSDATAVTEGDEELLSILANQIGQSLENARLFEQVYRSSQILESKVQDRTKQLASALEQVQRISRNKSEFVSAVSHELRTPLTSIKGYASLLLTGKIGDIPDQVKERLEKINKHSDNLVKLINDLLDISRIESGRVEMKFKKSDIAHVIDGVRDLLTPQMKDKNIHFKTEVPSQAPPVTVDHSQIERVFINLVGNAIKFTPSNGNIYVRVKPDKEKLSIEISDNGIGISEDDIQKLFSEFYRVENAINQNVKGTGLGLVLVKRIIEAHQGKIWVTSKLKEGTTFHFTLPYEHKKQAEDSIEIP